MFRLESYVTGIIISYIDKYISNFKRQDAQVSLWEGDAILQNLDLDLDVVNQELNLPFSLVSGHIHELHIHVPWTKIMSEPVVITINTIECVMKLKPPGHESPPRKRKEKKANNSSDERDVSLSAGLSFKIISNLHVTCNNLILKYVEEDIVFSMNIKKLHAVTVDRHWNPVFSVLSLDNLILRKLITLSDITICLDKRNSSGRIESYLEPILYKCSLKIKISRTFSSPSSYSAMKTRISFHSDDITLSISEPQVPMLLRLVLLAKVTFASSRNGSALSLHVGEGTSECDGATDEEQESWGTWVWNMMPSLPLYYPDAEQQSSIPHSVDIAAYIDKFNFNIKLVEEGKTWQSFMKATFEGCFMELSTNTVDWTNLLFGVSYITVVPLPQQGDEFFVKCGKPTPDYKKNSLYENPDINLVQRTWDLHISAITEKVLVDRAPAVAVDFISSIEIQPENWIDNYPSEPLEKTLMRYVIGIMEVNVTPGFIDRIETMKTSLKEYDYPAYSILSSVSGEDISIHLRESNSRVLEGLLPISRYQFTVVEAIVKVFPPLSNFQSSKQKLLSDIAKGNLIRKQPFLYFKVNSLDCSYTKPMYPDVLLHLKAQISPTLDLINASKSALSVTALSVRFGVKVDGPDSPDIIELYKINCSVLFNSLFETGPEVISQNCALQLERSSITSTKANVMLSCYLIESFISAEGSKLLFSSSLIQDSINHTCFPYFQMNISKVFAKFAKSNVSESLLVRVGSIDAKTFYINDSVEDQCCVLSANIHNEPWVFEGIAQRPLNGTIAVPFLIYFKLRQFHAILDNSVFKWLMYMPQTMASTHVSGWTSFGSGVSRKVSTSSISSLSKKLPEIVESSKEKDEVTPPVVPPVNNILRDFAEIMNWLSLAVNGELSNIKFSYRGLSGENSCTLNASIPFVNIFSAQGKFVIDSDVLPIPFGFIKKNSISYPLQIEVNGMSGWSTCGQNRETFFQEFNTTCTVAVTSSVVPSPTLSFSLHVDTSHISLSLRRLQMASLIEFWVNVMKVLTVLSHVSKPEETQVIRERKVSGSEESTSNSQTATTVINQKETLAPAASKNGFKLSWWLQWTLTKLTISLYTTPMKNYPEILKLSFDFEDIIFSMEVDSVYQKLKMKIGSSTIKHFIKDMSSNNWRVGSFGGLMMCAQEFSGKKSEFLALTVTRASAANLHSKLASLMKIPFKELTAGQGPDNRYVVEIVMSIEPLDFVIAPTVLMRFVSIVEPLLLYPAAQQGPQPGPPLTHLTTADLPLVYFDIHQVRVFICSSLPSSEKPDTFVFQIDEIALRSEAVNPVSRKLLRCDISRVTSVPGSRLEDRQYQLDLALEVMTGKWVELESQICGSEADENPAVAWNTVGAPHASRGAQLSTVLSKLKSSFIFAPPILSSGVLISGLYFEGNLVSEANFKLSVDEFKLLFSLITEVNCIFPEGSDMGIEMDSGIESVEGSFHTYSKENIEGRKSSRIAVSQKSVATSTSINTRGIRHRTQVVPSNILLTAKEINFKLFSKDESCSSIIPLVFVSVAQPYVSYEKQGDTTIYKASVFDLNVRHGMDGHFTDQQHFEGRDFIFSLLETKDGDPDPYKGIPPALANFKSTAVGMKLPSIDFEMGRPLKLSLNISSMKFMNKLQEILTLSPSEISSISLSHGSLNRSQTSHPRSLYSISDSSSSKYPYNKMISSLNVSTKQLVVEYIPINQESNTDTQFSISELIVNVSFPGQQISSNLALKGVVFSIGGHFVLTPWSVSCNANLINESWTPGYIYRLNFSSDVLATELFLPSVSKIQSLTEELTMLFEKKELEESIQDVHQKEEEDDENYLDDLQTGAFQFSSSTDLPLPYQVTFPSQAVMAWAYPYPRTINSLTVMPVPFTETCPNGLQVILEYLDPLQGWCKWVIGKMFEGQVSKIELPANKRAASTWRVVINTDILPFDVKALGGCVRVDSLFSRKLIPKAQVSGTLDLLSLCLWARPSECQPLRRFTPVSRLSRYPFSTMSVQSMRFNVHVWHSGQKEIKVEGRPKVEILNARTLKDFTVVHSFPVQVFIHISDEGKFKFKVLGDVISTFIAPSVTHSIQAALSGSFIQPYIVCNDTSYVLSFGQIDSGEDIPLYCLQSYFYAWKNTSHQMKLCFSISTSTKKHWSEGVPVTSEGTFPVEVTDDGGRLLRALIIVKKLSSVVMQITFTGELMIKNRLDKGLDVRIVPTSVTERQRIIHLEGEERCPAILLSKDSGYSLRLSMTSGWSGQIPLEAPMSWLVKVPHKGNGNFISMWCQLLKEQHHQFKKLLVIVSPMYIIKSLLPGDANVLISTDQLHSQMSLRVSGKGELTNLYTPGTTEHKHSFTFQIVGNTSAPSPPHVTLSYAELVQNTSPGNNDLSKAMEEEENQITKENWPLLGSPWDSAEWANTSQPSTVTRVKVRFCGEKLRVPHCVQIELEPWCLVVNTLGNTLAIVSGDDILCRIPHLSIVAPPYLENTFHLLVKFSEGGYHQSSGFQLSENQSFYKPHIPGLIPQVATVSFSIQSTNSVIYGILNSKMVKNIRVLHFASAYVITNLSSRDLYVVGITVSPSGRKLPLPTDVIPGFLFLPKKSSTDLSEPLTEWYGKCDLNDKKLYLLLKGSDGSPGNPIPVPIMPDAREKEALLLPSGEEESWYNTPLSVIFQEKEGTTFINIDDDPSPQIVIHNHTNHNLQIGTSPSAQGGSASDEYQDWNWRLTLPKGRCGFYRTFAGPGQPLPPLVVSKTTNSADWSGAISLTPSSGARLVALPGAHDLVATVSRVAFTTHLTLTPAHQSLISAADVRTRLTLLSLGSGPSTLTEDMKREPIFQEPPIQESITCKSGCIKTSSNWLNVEGDVLLKGFYFTICSDSDDSPDCKEVVAVSFEGVSAQLSPRNGLDKSDLSISIWDVQVDNQKYPQGGYDFCVVVTGRGSVSQSIKALDSSEPSSSGSSSQGNPTLKIKFGLDVTHSVVLESVEASAMPLELFLEDTFLTELKGHFEDLFSRVIVKPIKKTEIIEENKSLIPNDNSPTDAQHSPVHSNSSPSPFPDSEHHLIPNDSDDEWEIDNPKFTKIPVPPELIASCYELSRPLKLTKLLISPLSVTVSLHTSTKFYIALDQSPLSFSEFKRTDVVTSTYRLGHALSIHYLLGAIYGTGWALGSLQLLGAPAGLARSLGAGFSSLVSLPYEGLAYGPTGFLFGVFQGSASLMRHITAGTLSCVTKFAGSWSRTLDRLTLSPEDLRFAEEMRRLRPHGIADGIRQGLTEFGVSLLGGVGGLAQRPLEYAMGSSPSLVGSVGRGLVGAMARPLSGAAGLLAVTTQGILAGAGWAQVLKPKQITGSVGSGKASRIAHGHGSLLVMEGASGELEPCDLVLTVNSLKVVSLAGKEEVFSLIDIIAEPDLSDPTLILIYQQNHLNMAEKLSQKRIAEFVRESQRALGSPLPPTPPSLEPEPLLFYLSPEVRDYFVSFVKMVSRNTSQKGFPVVVSVSQTWGDG